ncbi:hypothetical protein J7643_04780 [bacterium]|nr:hypothetical protein [bacterium]
MRKHLLAGIAVLSLGVVLAPPALADPGKALGACATCHDISPAKNKLVGPPLFGSFGAKPLGDGIEVAKWDEGSLDKWLTNPGKMKPGTLMSYQVGNPKKRLEIIKALKELK